MSIDVPRPEALVAVVDDDPAVLRSVVRLLRVRGYEAQAFSSAELLLREVRQLAPSCIIADLSMPGLDGLAFQQALVGAGLGFPIVFITANGDIRSSVRAMRNGAVDFLGKPFAAEELFDALERALKQNRSSSDLSKRKAQFHERVASLTRRELQIFAA